MTENIFWKFMKDTERYRKISVVSFCEKQESSVCVSEGVLTETKGETRCPNLVSKNRLLWWWP